MKRFLLLWAFVALTACRVERVVEDPVVECNRTKSVTVVRIAALRDSTVVDLELRNLPAIGCGFRPAPCCGAGRRRRVAVAAGGEFPLDEKVTLNRTGLRRVRLVFGAVSRHDSTVDLLEPDGYRIEGIRLEAVRRPRGSCAAVSRGRWSTVRRVRCCCCTPLLRADRKCPTPRH